MTSYKGGNSGFAEADLLALIDDAIEHDGAVEISDSVFDFKEVDGKDKVTSIEFTNCRFRTGLKLVGISKGTLIKVENCKFEDNAGLVLERISVTSIYLVANNSCSSETESSLALGMLPSETITFVRVLVENLFVMRCDYHIEVYDSAILDEAKVTGVGENHSDRVITFLTSDLGNVTMTIQGCALERFSFEKCNLRDMNARYGIELDAGALIFASSKLGRFEVSKSDIGHMHISMENTPVRNVEIDDSNLTSGFNCYMSSSFGEADRRLHNLYIRNSVVGESSFSGRIFDLPLDLRNTKFVKAPKFHNAPIPQGSLFPDKARFSERGSDDAAKAYRTLRLAMEGQRAREEEGMFYALEQESILNSRFPKTKVFQLGFWYLKLSDCGTNYVKPLGYLIVVFFVFSILYALLSSSQIRLRNPIDWSLLERSGIFSLKQIFTPFWSLRDLSPLFDPSQISFLLSVLGLLQSLISVLLITLVVLAIRWHFKRG